MKRLLSSTLMVLGTSSVALAQSSAPAPSDLPQIPESEAWRSQVPKSQPQRAPVLPKFETAQLDNGLTVIIAPVRNLPLISFALVTKGGMTRDPKDKPGLTAMTYSMLEEGSGDRDALAFSDHIADLGARFSAGSDRESGAVSIGGLKRNADAMLSVVADAVRRPRLEPKDFERKKGQRVAALQRQRGSPQGLAFEAFPAHVYGADHPYGHPPGGTVESIGSLTLEDVTEHHANAFGPKASALIVAGDVTLDEAKDLAQTHLGDWTVAASAPPEIPAVNARPRKLVLLLDKPKTKQTMIVMGRGLFGRGHPEETALRVANEIYGGSFSSRLNMNLREEKGYTYGARSQLALRNSVSVFVAYSAVRKDATLESTWEFIDELIAFINKPPTEAEVSRAKSSMIRSLPGSFDTTSAVAGAAQSLFVQGLPLDYYDGLAEKYQAVTVEAVGEAAQRYLMSDRMQLLLVGDAADFGPNLLGLGLGRIQIRDKATASQ